MCNWWLFIRPFINKIIETLIKQHSHFTLYRCPHAVKEDSLMRLSFFCLMFTSVTSELTPPPNRTTHSLLKLKMFLANASSYRKKQPPTGWAHLGYRFHKHSIWKLEARMLLFWRGNPDLTYEGSCFCFVFFPSHSSTSSRKRCLGGDLPPPRVLAGRKLWGEKKNKSN